MKIAARSLLLFLLGVSVLATGCVQQTKTTPITTTNTTKLPANLKSAIFTVAAIRKTKDATKSLKEKDYDSAEKKCQQQLTLVDKIDLDDMAVKSLTAATSDLLLLKITCLHILGQIAGIQKNWPEAIHFHKKALEFVNEGAPLTPDNLGWDEFRGESYWYLAIAYQNIKKSDEFRKSVQLIAKQSEVLITKSKYSQKWRAINLLTNWELKRQDFEQHKTNNFAEDVANFQLMIDDIQKEAQAYRVQAADDEKALKLADHLDKIVLKLQSRVDKIYDKDIFDLRIAS